MSDTTQQHAFDSRRSDDLIRHGRRIVRTLDRGIQHDGASQMIEWLIEMVESVQGEVYLWRQGELTDEQAIEAVRDDIGF